MLCAGEMRMPTLSAPIASATAAVTSIAERRAVLGRAAVGVGAGVDRRVRGTGAAGSRWPRGSRRRRGRPPTALRAAVHEVGDDPGDLLGARARAASACGLAPSAVTISPGAATALGAIVSAPSLLSRVRDPAGVHQLRRRCDRPRSCTASATWRQPATCSSVWMPGCRGSPGPPALGCGALGDDQAGAGALAVVLDVRARSARRPRRAVAGQRRHDEGWGSSQRADPDGGEGT